MFLSKRGKESMKNKYIYLTSLRTAIGLGGARDFLEDTSIMIKPFIQPIITRPPKVLFLQRTEVSSASREFTMQQEISNKQQKYKLAVSQRQTIS